MRANIIRHNETQYYIEPTYGYAMKMAFSTGWYKASFIIGLIFLLAAVVLIALFKTDNIILPVGSLWVVYVIGILGAAAMAFILFKPSQLQANNTYWVGKVEFDRAVADGNETKWFTRYWT